MLTFIDFFSGIGGFRLGMEMAGHKCLGHCEIDKFANKSYGAIHEPGEDEWFGTDITEVTGDELPNADCWCAGFPCQDISVAGKQKGLDGDRSSLFFSITRLIREKKEEDRPQYLFLENVKNLFGVNKGFDFLTILAELDEIGYDVEWQVLNSKDYGVPQNRERIFIIGHLRGRSGREVFPIERDSQSSSIRVLGTTKSETAKGTNSRSWVHDTNGIIGALTATDYKQPKQILVYPCLTPNRLNKRQNGRRFKEGGEPMFTLTSQDRHGVLIKEATKKGYKEANIGDSINISFPNSKTRRGRVGKKVAQTLDTHCQQGTLDTSMRLRKLTPRECFRLQGIPDWAFDKAREVNSDSQLYKQAGNGVTVNVIYEIAKQLEGDE
ncbi:DNA (cytosine-5-)-methyltransferase [Metaclostridioides mangenotii]|uniref:DNA (cytosine-5-)-methyltransferase n=1 Tax=Metaclostridioides mangenotii TaxID=1540 RepID=UPI00048245E1|nr:DNA (cytosine-5-)-methyltransferase [Clostridioides mangenotii]